MQTYLCVQRYGSDTFNPQKHSPNYYPSHDKNELHISGTAF